jgi:hypothetical protein
MYSRPDLANVIRALSTFMDCAHLAAYKGMQRAIKFVLNTKLYSLKLQSKHESEEMDLVSNCNSNWARDPESKISVTGFIIYLLEIPICSRSNAAKGVTLYSSEAEFVTTSTAVEEFCYIFHLFRSMFIEVRVPVMVRCKFVGAIFMAENLSSGACTRLADTRYSFVHEHIVDEFIKIIFVKLCDNDVGISSKNVSKDTCTKTRK